MKPYYQDDYVTIYHGDCREILPDLPQVDLVLTDPPYGIALETAYRQRGRGRWAECTDYGDIVGDDEMFNPDWLLGLQVPLILWGANYHARSLPPSSGWLVWDKRVGMPSNDQADGELAWTNIIKGVRIFRHRWNGFHRDSEKASHYHPTQKPVALMAWCLMWATRWLEPSHVLDPYMGAGPVPVAAKRLNRKCIGIEIEERYCEIAANRCRQMVFDLS